MSKLVTARMAAAGGNVKDAFRNQDGAIDLASIMVGIIVIGLIGGVIAATVFAVIPWAQDNAAKEQLKAAWQAENVYAGFSADENLQAASLSQIIIANGPEIPEDVENPEPVKRSDNPADYGTASQLKKEGLFDADAAGVRIAVTVPKDGSTLRGFTAVKQSDSGKWFFIADGFNVRALEGVAGGSVGQALSEAVTVVDRTQEWVQNPGTTSADQRPVPVVSGTTPPNFDFSMTFERPAGGETGWFNHRDVRTGYIRVHNAPDGSIVKVADDSSLPAGITFNPATNAVSGQYDESYQDDNGSNVHVTRFVATSPDGRTATVSVSFNVFAF